MPASARPRHTSDPPPRPADFLPQFAWVADPDGRVLYCDPHRYADCGSTPADASPAAVHPDDLPAVRAAWATHHARGTAFEYEARFRRAADGAYRWHLARVSPVRDANGDVVRWVGSACDVEDRRRVESGLRDAARRKDEFLATLAHELRNPLAPLRSGLEVLKRAGGDPDVAASALAMMERQVAGLTRLVDDLLDVSRINRGKVALRPEPLDLRAVVDRAVETVRPLVDARGHTLAVDLPPDPLPVAGDLTRLTQVVVNLLHNAAKYTEEGGQITLTVARDGAATGVLTVRDTGMGIVPGLLPTVFDLFAQGQRALDRAQGGLGVGLTVVKSLVELHGGSVSAASDGPGTGATFTVRLPLLASSQFAVRSSQPEKQSSDSDLRTANCELRTGALRVLVVDDNVDSARMIGLLLGLWGHDARTAHDGPAALAVAEQFRPDLVLLDIGLPGLNGYEVADRLRALPGLDGVKVVAVTGYGHDEDRRRSTAAGFAGHMVKPVEPADLEAVVNRFAGLKTEC